MIYRYPCGCSRDIVDNAEPGDVIPCRDPKRHPTAEPCDHVIGLYECRMGEGVTYLMLRSDTYPTPSRPFTFCPECGVKLT